VNAGEDTQPVVRVAAFRTEKTEAGKEVRLGQMVPVDELVGAEVARTGELALQGGEECLQARAVDQRGVGSEWHGYPATALRASSARAVER